MSEKPVLQLPDRPNFMVVNGETFFVERITQSPESLLKHVEEYYEANIQNLRAQMAHHISEESDSDLADQIGRIERHLAKGIVALPDELRSSGSVMMHHSNKLYATKQVLFRPSRISCSLRRVSDILIWVDREISRKDAERYTSFAKAAKTMVEHFTALSRDLSSIKIDLSFEQDIVIEPMLVSFVADIDQILCVPANVHCHVYQDSRRLCTGNTNARVFFEDPQFIANFNSINPHSPANSACRAFEHHKNMLKNQYFQELRVREQEASAWRV